jgi:hypothetical protein
MIIITAATEDTRTAFFEHIQGGIYDIVQAEFVTERHKVLDVQRVVLLGGVKGATSETLTARRACPARREWRNLSGIIGGSCPDAS